MSKIIVNNQEYSYEEADFPDYLPALLSKLDIGAEGLVAEIDGVVVLYSEFAVTRIKPGSKIELVHLVQGGKHG